MPSTYTGSGIELIATGEQSGVWGDTTNLNLQIVDRLTSQAGTITLSGTTHTLTVSDGTLSDGQYGVLVFAGSPSGTNTVTISPNTARRIFMVRNTTAQSVVLSQGSGANVTVPSNTSKIVYTSGTGAVAAVFDITNVISANITGNAGTATTLQTARTINGVSFNGSANITITANTPNTLTRGTYLTGSNFNGSAATTWAVDATTTNTASKVVARDASGNFAAGTITASLSGNATTATNIAGYSGTYWTSNNDGSGSGLDADLLDGLNSTDFARYVAAGTVNNALADAAWVTNYTSSTNVDHIWHDDTGNAWNFVSDSTFKGTANSRLNAGSFYANGNVVWNAGNDGAGSGLDADLLDGQQGSYYYPASNPNGYTTNTGTVTSINLTAGGAITVSGGPITTSGSITVNHADTSSQGSVNNSGRTFIQDITLDTYGHVTGIVSATDADTFTGTVTSVATGGGLTGGTITTTGTISHADTSSQASVNNSGATVIQDVTLDTYGHVTALGSTTLTAATVGAVPRTAATGAAVIPVGTTAQRPTPATGHLRFNSDAGSFEGYDGAEWGAIGGGGGAVDDLFYENAQVVAASYTIGATRNAMTTGPISINSGVSVTVSSGARWVIL